MADSICQVYKASDYTDRQVTGVWLGLAMIMHAIDLGWLRA